MRLCVNGEIREVATENNKTLLEVLREDMALTGTKHGCELGECGTCSVLVDGKPVLSCLLLGIEAVNAEIVTVEGMMQNGKPHALQKAFADLGAAQCGYCIPGILLTAKALLRRTRAVTKSGKPSREIFAAARAIQKSCKRSNSPPGNLPGKWSVSYYDAARRDSSRSLS